MSTALTRGQRLAAEAAEAAEVRAYQTDPDVVALRVEKARVVVEWFIWTGMVLGLAFTMSNVQQFAAHTIHAAPGSLSWSAAWLLDPTVSLVLLGILLAERHTSRWQIAMSDWTRAAKWGLLAATYVMNTWESYAASSAAGIVLHSVPPLVVFMAAEAVTDLQDKLTECVHKAHAHAAARAETPAPIPVIRPAVAQRPDVPEPTRPLGHPGQPGVHADSARPARVDPGWPAFSPAVQPGQPTTTEGQPGPPRGERSEPDRKPKTDAQLAAEVRAMTRRNGGVPPSQHELRQTLGIGSTRAARLLAGLTSTNGRTEAT